MMVLESLCRTDVTVETADLTSVTSVEKLQNYVAQKPEDSLPNFFFLDPKACGRQNKNPPLSLIL
jgi:hypothetical protein